MHRRLLFLTMLGAAACGPTNRPQVTLGDPVENVVTVTFESEAKGDGVLLWEHNGRAFRRKLGPAKNGRWETTIWIPSGRSTAIRGAVDDGSGDLIEGPAKRVRLPEPPKSMRWKLHESDPRSQIGDGVLLLNAYKGEESYAFALNGDADVVWWVEPDRRDQRWLRLRPGLDGQSIVASRWAADHKAEDDGWITRFDLTKAQARTDTRAVDFHHDFVELPDERFAWLSWTYDGARWVSGIGTVPVAADAIRVASEGASAGEEEVLYDLLEDYPEGVYYSCGHMSPGGFAGEWWEWSHSNSIAYDAETDSLRFLARYWDSVVQVGLDGELDWTAGGVNSEFQLDGWFNHAHASELTGSDWVVFDNGNHGPTPEVSRALGLEVDFDAGVVRESWSIPDPSGQFTTYLGDVRTLPGGNVLVLWSPRGLLQEFTPNGQVVWEAEIDSDLVVGRVTWTDQLVPR